MGGFFERIVPDHEMPRGPLDVAASDEIAVREQNRHLVLVRFDTRRVDRHDVRAVKKIGNAPKTLGLALSAIGRTGPVQAHEPGIRRGIDGGLDFELESPVRRLRDGKLIGRGGEALGGQRLAVERDRDELEFVAIKHERHRCARTAGLDFQLGVDPGLGRIERDVEIDALNEPIWGAIVRQADGTQFFGAHWVDLELPRARRRRNEYYEPQVNGGSFWQRDNYNIIGV